MKEGPRLGAACRGETGQVPATHQRLGTDAHAWPSADRGPQPSPAKPAKQIERAAPLDPTAPETATPTGGAANTRVEAAFQEAKKKGGGGEERKRKRRDSGDRAPAAAPAPRPLPVAARAAALASRRSPAVQPSAPSAGPALPAAGDLRCVSRPRRGRH